MRASASWSNASQTHSMLRAMRRRRLLRLDMSKLPFGGDLGLSAGLLGFVVVEVGVRVDAQSDRPIGERFRDVLGRDEVATRVDVNGVAVEVDLAVGHAEHVR